MKHPSQLTSSECRAIVSELYIQLFVELSADSKTEVTNPDKACSGADLVDFTVRLFDRFGLMPSESWPWES